QLPASDADNRQPQLHQLHRDHSQHPQSGQRPERPGAGEADAAATEADGGAGLVAEAAGEGLQTGDEAAAEALRRLESTLAAVASLVAGARSSLAELQRVCEPHHQPQQQQQQAALASVGGSLAASVAALMQGSAGRWGIEGLEKNFARHHQQQQQQQQQIMQLALMQFAASPFVPAPSLAAAAPLISPGAAAAPAAQDEAADERGRQVQRPARKGVGLRQQLFPGDSEAGLRGPPAKSTGSLAECARLRAAAAGDRWLSAVPDSLVSSLRRQAQQEARAAVAAAEARAEQLLAAERLRSQRMAARIREEALAASRVQVGSAETCWNCGRIASETCSGCSAARYCGSFCQHRDWDRHRATCGILAQQAAARCRIPRAWRELVEAAAEAAGAAAAEAEAAGAAAAEAEAAEAAAAPPAQIPEVEQAAGRNFLSSRAAEVEVAAAACTPWGAAVAAAGAQLPGRKSWQAVEAAASADRKQQPMLAAVAAAAAGESRMAAAAAGESRMEAAAAGESRMAAAAAGESRMAAAAESPGAAAAASLMTGATAKRRDGQRGVLGAPVAGVAAHGEQVLVEGLDWRLLQDEVNSAAVVEGSGEALLVFAVGVGRGPRLPRLALLHRVAEQLGGQRVQLLVVFGPGGYRPAALAPVGLCESLQTGPGRSQAVHQTGFEIGAHPGQAIPQLQVQPLAALVMRQQAGPGGALRQQRLQAEGQRVQRVEQAPPGRRNSAPKVVRPRAARKKASGQPRANRARGAKSRRAEASAMAGAAVEVAAGAAAELASVAAWAIEPGPFRRAHLFSEAPQSLQVDLLLGELVRQVAKSQPLQHRLYSLLRLRLRVLRCRLRLRLQRLRNIAVGAGRPGRLDHVEGEDAAKAVTGDGEAARVGGVPGREQRPQAAQLGRQPGRRLGKSAGLPGGQRVAKQPPEPRHRGGRQAGHQAGIDKRRLPPHGRQELQAAGPVREVAPHEVRAGPPDSIGRAQRVLTGAGVGDQQDHVIDGLPLTLGQGAHQVAGAAHQGPGAWGLTGAGGRRHPVLQQVGGALEYEGRVRLAQRRRQADLPAPGAGLHSRAVLQLQLLAGGLIKGSEHPRGVGLGPAEPGAAADRQVGLLPVGRPLHPGRQPGVVPAAVHRHRRLRHGVGGLLKALRVVASKGHPDLLLPLLAGLRLRIPVVKRLLKEPVRLWRPVAAEEAGRRPAGCRIGNCRHRGGHRRRRSRCLVAAGSRDARDGGGGCAENAVEEAAVAGAAEPEKAASAGGTQRRCGRPPKRTPPVPLGGGAAGGGAPAAGGGAAAGWPRKESSSRASSSSKPPPTTLLAAPLGSSAAAAGGGGGGGGGAGGTSMAGSSNAMP
uniref:MYND-type domain-containing protein n=1 Tax=Macrostomum lignano TaxID=282301 RepID=A0A1I8GZ15_9PLAT